MIFLNAIYIRTIDLIKQRGYSVSAFERELNFANGTISKWKESMPKMDKIVKTADFFGVTTDYLIGRDNSKQANPQPPQDLKDYLANAKYYDGKEIDPTTHAILNDVVASILKNRK